ncbi:phosphatidylglycerophosphate phosphatase PTPMT1-like [Miscanthus floridulus]|uniref:phosphatidylglycerophosphate phosphatase PTPMT1-like n=1 Tax=Miscanthus floridulus TaxID=154761 RepID=UPI00345A5BB1
MRIRELRDGLEVEDDEREEEGSWGGGGDGEVVAVVRLRAKRALVGTGARVLFYPTLLYNVLRNRFDGEFRWWDRVDKYVLLGAVPFSSDVPRLKQLGVRGVVTLNEAYETLVPTSLYQAHGINHLEIPTRDYLFAPSLEHICRAVDFIHFDAAPFKQWYLTHYGVDIGRKKKAPAAKKESAEVFCLVAMEKTLLLHDIFTPLLHDINGGKLKSVPYKPEPEDHK